MVWFREFRLVFGASTAASAAVMAVFMGGLGLGNLVLGRRVDRTPNPLLWYAGLEMSVALSTAASPLLVDLARRGYVALGGQLSLGFTAATALRLLLAVLVLGLPTFLMGGTLAAAARAVTPADDEHRRDTAILYALNTLGAVSGALLSTFLVIELLGNRQTLWLACGQRPDGPGGPRPGPPGDAPGSRHRFRCVGGRAGGAAAPAAPVHANRPSPVQLRKMQRAQRSGRLPAAASAAARAAVAWHQPPAAVIYAAAGVVGFAFFVMELVWYRMLGPILGGSTFTFGMILAVALAGIGLGGAVYPLLFARLRPTLRWFALTCGLEALAMAAAPCAGRSRGPVDGAIAARPPGRFAQHDVARLGRAVAALGAALRRRGCAVAAGGGLGDPAGRRGQRRAIPAADRPAGPGRRPPGPAGRLGRGLEYRGRITGSLAGGFGLLPLLSAPGAWRAVVGLLVVLSLLLVLVAGRVRGGGPQLPDAACAGGRGGCGCIAAPGPDGRLAA